MRLHYCIIMSVVLLCNTGTPLHAAAHTCMEPRCSLCGGTCVIRCCYEIRSLYRENQIRILSVDDKYALYTDESRLMFGDSNVRNALIKHIRDERKKSGVLDFPTESKPALMDIIKSDGEMDSGVKNNMEEGGQTLDGITPLIYCAVARKPTDVLGCIWAEKEYRNVLRDLLKRGHNPLAQARVYHIHNNELTFMDGDSKKADIHIKEASARASEMVYDPPALCMLLAAEKRWAVYPAIKTLVDNVINSEKSLADIVINYCAGDSVEMGHDQEEFVNKVVESRGYSKQFISNKLAQTRQDDIEKKTKK